MAGTSEGSIETQPKETETRHGDDGNSITAAQVEHSSIAEKDITHDEEKSRPHAVTQEEYLGGGNIADHAIHMSAARRTALFARYV